VQQRSHNGHDNRAELARIREHWENEKTVSIKDKNLQELERECIVDELRKLRPRLLVDLGCGDCSDTVYYCNYASVVHAYDYSSTMLQKASRFHRDNLLLKELNILDQDIDVKADAVITKRCLINLGNFENQKMAIKKIYNSLNGDGYYLMLECSYDGLNTLNGYRKLMGLQAIEPSFHNVYFNWNELREYVDRLYVVEKTGYFSLYYFFTRFYNQLIDDTDYKKFDSIAKRLHKSLGMFHDVQIGAQFFMMLRKKEP